MKKLLIISFALLLIGCSNPTEQQEKSYPYTAGAFLIHSPTYAEFIGTGGLNGKANTTYAEDDTVTITQPDGEILRLRTDDGYTGGVHIMFRDPTLLADSIALTKTELSFPTNNFYEFNGLLPGIVDDPGVADYQFNIYYKCGTGFSTDHIYITTYRDTAQTDIYRVYDFVADSASTAIVEVANCPNP